MLSVLPPLLLSCPSAFPSAVCCRYFKEDGPAETRDCYMEVVAFESSLFSLELPDALSTVYNSRINDNEALLLSPEDARRKQAQAAAMAGLSFLRDKVAFR